MIDKVKDARLVSHTSASWSHNRYIIYIYIIKLDQRLYVTNKEPYDLSIHAFGNVTTASAEAASSKHLKVLRI